MSADSPSTGHTDIRGYPRALTTTSLMLAQHPSQSSPSSLNRRLSADRLHLDPTPSSSAFVLCTNPSPLLFTE